MDELNKDFLDKLSEAGHAAQEAGVRLREMLIHTKEFPLETVDEQVKFMEAQLAPLASLLDKMHYMSIAFDPDPTFSKKARDIVRSNIARNLPVI